VFAAERRQAILAMVRANGAMSMRELARVTDASEVTIRRDLRALEADGHLSRRHGGAVAVGGSVHEPSYTEKTHVAADEKAAIAEVAAGLIEDGDALVIGPGTTTQALARRLVRFHELTVVTNSLLVAQALGRARGVEVFVTGGTLRGPTHALVGGSAEQTLAGLRTPKAFLSGNGLTVEHGLSTPNLHTATIDRAIVATARQVVVLADHTKVGVDAMVQTVPASQITTLVTDNGVPAAELGRFRAAGIDVRVAAVGG
jgi:DeoR/GlpR family transcriptional regulator of sugar metabolism